MKYSELFIGRPGYHALAYKKGRGYRPIKRPLSPLIIRKHLVGDIVAGLYLIRPKDNGVRLVAFDIDQDDPSLSKTIARNAVIDVPDTSVLIERTGGRGWHVWIFFDDWIEARLARAFMRSILEGIELSYPVELYPKQDRIRAEGLGNLVRLPLGVHQRTGNTGVLHNAFGLPFEIDGNEEDPDLPIEPAPHGLVRRVAEMRLEAEKAVMPVVDDGGPATLACISHFRKGVKEGARDEAMFRLAAYLHRQQIPKDAAWLVLAKANEGNKPPLTDTELNVKLNSAFSGAGYGLPCSSDLVGLDSEFCNPSCPVYSTAKARAGGAAVGRLPDAAGSKFPRLVERDHSYIYQSINKSGILEKSISNFVMEVLSRLEMPGDDVDVLRVRAIAQTGREDIMDVPVSAFSSKAMLLRKLTRAEYAWYGSDVHCQYLKSHLTSIDLETQIAVTRVGRYTTEEGIDIWVTPKGVVTPNGVETEGTGYTYHRPEHFGIIHIRTPEKSFSKDRAKKAARDLWNLNTAGVMTPVIGWSFAVPFKPFFMERLGHFPLLMLYGTRGAGKTQLIQRTVMPLFGYSAREPQIFFCDTTRFVMVSYGASSATVPLFYDEYRPNALPSTKLRQIWDHWRHLYAEDTDHRGQSDLSRLSFKQTAPIIIAGEEMVMDPAMQERIVQVGMSPDNLTRDRQKAFRSMPPMELASLEFIKHSLSINPVPILDAARERISGQWEQLVSPRVYDNMLVVSFGLGVWSKFTGRKVTKEMTNHIFDVSQMVIDDEGGVRTALWVDDFILDVAGIVEEKGPFTWGVVERDGDNSMLYINLRRAHAEWAKDMRARGDHAVGIQPIKRQLSEEAAARFVVKKGMQKRMMGANTRVYAIDLTAMRDVIDE